jgi:hypothetical protein
MYVFYNRTPGQVRRTVTCETEFALTTVNIIDIFLFVGSCPHTLIVWITQQQMALDPMTDAGMEMLLSDIQAGREMLTHDEYVELAKQGYRANSNGRPRTLQAPPVGTPPVKTSVTSLSIMSASPAPTPTLVGESIRTIDSPSHKWTGNTDIVDVPLSSWPFRPQVPQR